MPEQEMLLDSATIKAAVAGEKWATEKVIEHYTPMIDELAVDEDMKQHLIMKLLEALPNFPWIRQKGKKIAPDSVAIQPPRPALRYALFIRL